jgi:hypothetical protein
MSNYDLILKNSYLVDPATNVEGYVDIGISDGKIAAVEKELFPTGKTQVVDIRSNIVVPGLIDTHVHLTGRWREYGHRMLARAGVTTALDCGGPVDEIINDLPDWGAGINVAVLNGVVPEKTVSSSNPETQELTWYVRESLEAGALGIKIMGGHYPLTPDATRESIRIANAQLAYVAFHAGTTTRGSNLEGMKQALELAEGLQMQLCHVNAYCRGITLGDPAVETLEAISQLSAIKGKGIVTESHLGPFNGTSGKCKAGVPESHVTRTCLRTGGFPETTDGLRQAIKSGYALVNRIQGDEIDYATPDEGERYWDEQQTDVTVSFPVNKRDTAFLLAMTKDSDADFVIDALSTDGGGIPRNFLVSKGLLLVKFNALSLKEFVWKTSTVPARMLGLETKGHFTPGADADITVIDLTREEPILTIVSGEIVMQNGIVFGRGGTILTTEMGASRLKQDGVPHRVVQLASAEMYRR